ncbi:MAG: M23 family metallopeptidase [Muribaculaceae bacterium]|nr:M23 family metallopeptidase [Muribaculaceae bacterium]
MHQDYIAGIGNNANKIKNEETNKFVNGVLGNETEELTISDIDEQFGWDNPRVNCYTGVEVPATAKIDVTGFYMPVSGQLTSGYGYRPRFRRMHRGVDLNLNTGDTVRAAFNGRVRIVNYEAKGYGKYVVIRHDNGLETVYGHFSKHLVERNQFVKAGEPIGLGGNTGRSFGAHLHFETRYLGVAINPAAIIDFDNATVHSDVFTFNKTTYQNSRNYSPAAAQKSYANKTYKSKANKRSKKYSKSKSKKSKATACSKTNSKSKSKSKKKS